MTDPTRMTFEHQWDGERKTVTMTATSAVTGSRYTVSQPAADAAEAGRIMNDFEAMYASLRTSPVEPMALDRDRPATTTVDEDGQVHPS